MKTRHSLLLLILFVNTCAPQARTRAAELPAVKLAAVKAHGAILWEEFQTDPLQNRWKQLALPWQKFKGQWLNEGETKYISVAEGYWESPPVAVKPFGYYRLSFQSRSEMNGFCWAQFYDKEGKEIIADDHDSFFTGDDKSAWNEQEFFFRAHALATHVRVRFAADKSPIDIARVGLHAVVNGDVTAWSIRTLNQIPQVEYSPPADRGGLLPITAEHLKNGGTLRIVMLGDSICNDTSNSLYEAQLHKKYPRTRFEVIASVRGGTGSTWYQKENRVAEYVVSFKPDLLIIAGISHGNDAEAIRSVIRQVRAHASPDILVLSDVITPGSRMAADYIKYSGLPEQIAKDNIRLFPQRLRGMARIEEVEYFDMRSSWNEYLQHSWQPVEWFQRDEIHGNVRAKQVVGAMLARYLAFVPTR